jgi:hypothetical protein
MSIGPLAAFGAAGDVQLADATLRAARQAVAPPTDPGSVPKREVQATKNSSSQLLSEQDEVQVQRDTELQYELIFKYVNGAGSLILQVPSEQALSVKRGILEEFRQRASRPSTPARRP